MKNIYLVLGLSLSGKASSFFLLNQCKTKQVIAIEDNFNEDDEIRLLKKQNVRIFNSIDFIENFSNFKKIEKVIISPGFNPDSEIVKIIKKNKIEIISEIELGARFLKRNLKFPNKKFKNKIIGITGTNGKTTLTKLIEHILNENNIKAKGLGNIKIPFTSYLTNNLLKNKQHAKNSDEIFILELSSFQLEKTKTKFLDAAIITNITEDHLDRYPNFRAYANAKLRIVKCLKNEKNLYVEKKVLKSFIVNNSKINIKEVKEDIKDIAIKICLDLKIAKKNILYAIKTFKTLEHRLEFVREIKGVYFYNDSKATNVDSVIYAVKKIKGPIILIVGGKDKGFSYRAWNKHFKDNVKYVLAIGESSKKIKKELIGFRVQIMKDLKTATEKAFSLAKKEDRVLLSPGCSSFDMFKNFEHRGDSFKKFVSILGDK
ncbi:MAG: UDP-N-acetylmuramoylalanine--D-glutamate ligase [Candidatus Anoxychlamydiales bacterium]|nr:UDP-N-acetylmuramoylalanine--D-glutamate ligase [Candidatus Anoxychlamydiales bacterium]NGX41162.1 UDP-N-acetylmuramoylalanine--D-glutamate ligase [Candidatus Anoxychlamydiales bacterium]HEU64852.1 UDP-N-acetylmuramoyl-L-alanine--D-glutamate ligase [Chlamydiota bacterium]